MENQSPLVSICIVSYNSAKTIVETLDSAAAQTYKNIELIISDDCSKDNTLSIAKEWLDLNSSRFVRTEIITTPQNTGISPNCNRAWKAASGKWIKLIAADDIMVPKMTEIFIDYAQANPNDKVLFCLVEIFGTDEKKSKTYKKSREMLDKVCKELQTANQQYKRLKISNFIAGPMSFIKREVFENVNGYDEDILFIEDHPFWIKLAKVGYKLTLIPYEAPLIMYRASETSIQGANPKFMTSLRILQNKYLFCNPFYYIFKWGISQMYPTSIVSRICISVIEITSIPQRYILYKKIKSLEKSK